MDRLSRRRVLRSAAALAGVGWLPPPAQVDSLPAAAAGPADGAGVERDDVFLMLAYSIVLKDWQQETNGYYRGYNIGSVLVDPDGRVAAWGRNSVRVTANKTQHGELRAVSCYLSRNRQQASLKGYTLYTTLEPCAMCAGMMYITEVSRTVYGQSDPAYGGTIERLNLNETCGGTVHTPYPRRVESVGSDISFRRSLDQSYDNLRGSHPDLTLPAFLATGAARAIFEAANRALTTYEVAFPENEQILRDAVAYLAAVPGKYTKMCPTQ